MRYASICSGVEAASLAWESLGWTPAWFAEIEPFPSAVLAHHWPDVPNYGDMTKLVGRILTGEIEAPDILVGGTPCQAFSVAGRRASLDDERGNLTLTLVRILDAIDSVRRKQGKPACILVWENVPGVLNTKDNAFGCFLGALAGEDVALQPPRARWTNAGYVSGERQICWRVLDAQYFGVPQRRRRVFVVAGAGIAADTWPVLFEPAGETGNLAAGESAGENAAVFVESSFGAYRKDNIGGTVKASGGAVGGGSETVVVANTAATLTLGFGARGVDSDQIANGNCAIHNMQVRRLTPLECERLQGMPDNHTKIPWRAKPAEDCPDRPRYKAIGNSMAVPVMRWIGNRIKDFINTAERPAENTGD